MRSSLTITSSSVSGIVMIVYPAFVVRRDVKASSIRALSSRNKTVHISASVLFFSVAPILSLSLSLSLYVFSHLRPMYLSCVSLAFEKVPHSWRRSVVEREYLLFLLRWTGSMWASFQAFFFFLYLVDGIFDHMIGHVVFVPCVWYANGGF